MPKKDPKKDLQNTLMRNYISELDMFLQNFDKKPEAYSESRCAEEALYEKIGMLRDNAVEMLRDNAERKRK